MLKQQHQVFVGLLVFADAAIVASACFGAWAVRRLAIERTWWPESWEHPPKEALVLFIVPVVLLALRQFGLYRPRRDRSMVNEIVQVFKSSLAAMVVVLALLYVFQSSIFTTSYGTAMVFGQELDAGRVQLGTLAILLPFLLALERGVFRSTLRILRKRGWNQRHVVVIGVGRLGQIVTRTLERNSWTGIRVCAFVSHQDTTVRKSCQGRPIRGGLDDLESVLESEDPDAVYLALPNARADQLHALLARLERFPVDVRIVPDLNPRYVPQSMTVSELDGMPILSYRENPTSGAGAVTKRVIDVLGATVGLLVFSPVMLLVALLVRRSGPGPVIFRQKRVSLGGEVFEILKFRTMQHASDEQSEASWTSRNDSRITPIGAWLRRTSLDELPQLLNVLMGDMSLVGPRPERPELIARFRDDWRGYMLRQHVKAGITGWAQVNGLRGQTSLRKRLQYDLFYVRHWSLSFDLRILVLTVFRGFVHKNAH